MRSTDICSPNMNLCQSIHSAHNLLENSSCRLKKVWETNKGRTRDTSENSLTACTPALIFPQDTPSSGLAPESQPSNSWAVLINTQRSRPSLHAFALSTWCLLTPAPVVIKTVIRFFQFIRRGCWFVIWDKWVRNYNRLVTSFRWEIFSNLKLSVRWRLVKVYIRYITL